MPPEETSEAVAQKTEKVGETETRSKNQKILTLLPEELQKKMLNLPFNRVSMVVIWWATSHDALRLVSIRVIQYYSSDFIFHFLPINQASLLFLLAG